MPALDVPPDADIALRLLRVGVRPAQFARACGCSRQYISQVLAGQCRPSLRLLRVLSRLERAVAAERR